MFRWNKFELFVAFFFYFKKFSFMGLWKGPMPSLEEAKVGKGEMEGSQDNEERQD